jgi:hypothetical protein
LTSQPLNGIVSLGMKAWEARFGGARAVEELCQIAVRQSNIQCLDSFCMRSVALGFLVERERRSMTLLRAEEHPFRGHLDSHKFAKKALMAGIHLSIANLHFFNNDPGYLKNSALCKCTFVLSQQLRSAPLSMPNPINLHPLFIPESLFHSAPEHIAHNREYLALLHICKALITLLDNAVQQAQIARPQITNHQHLGLCEPVRRQPLDQLQKIRARVVWRGVDGER